MGPDRASPAMSASDRETLWSVQFQVDSSWQHLPLAHCVERQRTSSRAYLMIGAHRRQRLHVLKLTLAGEGRFEDGRRQYALRPGDAFLCRVSDPNIRYYYPPEGVHPWEFIFLSFWNGNPMVEELLDRYGPLYHLGENSAFEKRLTYYERFAGQFLALASQDALALTGSVFQGCLACSQERSSPLSPAQTLVRGVRQVITGRVSEDISVGEVARMLKVTPEHLCRVFKRETGQTIRQALSEEKMHYAADLLSLPDLGVKEVAARLGFKDPSHFSRYFRREMKVSPNEYRRKHSRPETPYKD